jgi:hypothetical protein
VVTVVAVVVVAGVVWLAVETVVAAGVVAPVTGTVTGAVSCPVVIGGAELLVSVAEAAPATPSAITDTEKSARRTTAIHGSNGLNGRV